MNTEIREYIKNNFKDSSIDDLRESIVSSIESKDELVLPGLGVLFEIFWNNSNNQEDILNIIKNKL
ncbi:MAG: small acid-soluble spore protein SspI [Bacilli bacterium]